ncbi:FAD-dependent oxidoreductase [Spongiibacter taiwanensis]|uniref:glycerol-3-phosphate dehydrogenase/oxidase n=1 Tax=Spongiibacter taiwanensis TaxID=1748242 RepID=UPI0020366696|nr:FAD-dependent oxidoreductase [Spongiibacter taiwanensis]USA41979.1 FAD-dependent oxidoreductase [Spongiibacter taiwanensis]
MSEQHIETEVAVIGGGVQGAGIAQAAAAAGYKVTIFERHHWAAGTSQRSSKLIHGGLRYLETGQIPLVYHSLQERARLLKNAPDLVKPVKFFIPIYKDTSRRPWQIRAGLTLYYLLSGGGQLARFRSVPKSEWDQLDGISTNDLQAVFQYWDGQTNDKLLTEAVIRSAQEMGVTTLASAELMEARKTANGYRLTIRTLDGHIHCDCKCLVNAGGPWVNDIGHRIETDTAPRSIDLVRGSHILVNKTLSQGVYYMESPRDGRAVFAMPWGDKALIGTTEVIHEEGADNVTPSTEEISYLQATFGHFFKNDDATVLEAWAGLRVLPKSSELANKRDRDTFFLCDDPKKASLIAVYGGKLTSYRHTAERVMDYITESLGKRTVVADTRRLPLSPLPQGSE